MHQVLRLSLALALLTLGACGPRTTGPHVRFAQASAADLHAAQQSGQVVWYDFEPGDDVPIVLGVIGMAEAVSQPPARLVARRHFSIVLFPDGRTFFSFDGRHLVDPTHLARWTIGLEPNDDTGSGVAVLLMFIGQAQDMPSDAPRR
ncbi:MAG: hypothetical protein KC668_12170 [Myxococcales bacterium]|nr:hypothetical protein [Myxococcales bacterium]